MATQDPTFTETSLTDSDGVAESEAIELLVDASDEVDGARDWTHWRTSPNYTCMSSGPWTVQVGRNDPIIGLNVTTDERQVAVITTLEDAQATKMVSLEVAASPKDVLVELLKHSDEDGVWAYELDGDDAPSLAGYLMRQAAWGDRATETSTHDNKGDA